MRIASLLCLLAPAQVAAWEFRTDPICTLLHTEAAAEVRVTFDPATALYAVAITRADEAWGPSAQFGIAFEGGAALTIGTSRHVIEGATLSVTDRGFGNVLSGLEFNTQATAFTSQQRVTFSLIGAAEPVQAFRQCASTPAPSV